MASVVIAGVLALAQAVVATPGASAATTLVARVTRVVPAAVAVARPSYGISRVFLTVEDLQTGQRWSVNGDRRTSFMSSAKFLWAIAAAIVHGNDLATIDADARATFAWSDNRAAGRLIDAAGGIDVMNTQWAPALGMARTCTSYWTYDNPARVAQQPCGTAAVDGSPPYGNFGTTDDYVTMLSRLWHGQVPGLTAPARAAVLSWSTLSPDALDPLGEGTLTGYLPPAVQASAHHKIGWYFDPYEAASDIGIIETAQGAYAIAIMVQDGASSEAQQVYMADVSCNVYAAFTGSGWPCPHSLSAAPVSDEGDDALRAPTGPIAARSAVWHTQAAPGVLATTAPATQWRICASEVRAAMSSGASPADGIVEAPYPERPAFGAGHDAATASEQGQWTPPTPPPVADGGPSPSDGSGAGCSPAPGSV